MTRPFDVQRLVGTLTATAFGRANATDRYVRAMRFLEEALELVQAVGLFRDEAQAQLDYTYGRRRGDEYQELGGTVITLQALAESIGFDMLKCGEDELRRFCEKLPEFMASADEKLLTKPQPRPRDELTP